MKYDFYTGSYAGSEKESIALYTLDTETGTLAKKLAVSGVENPSYLLMHPGQKVMYSVEELHPEGRIAVFRMEGELPVYVCSVSTGGADPCHLSMDDEGQYLFASNYSGGSLAVFRLDDDGLNPVRTDLVQHTGHSAMKGRQDGAHVHFSRWINGLLYSCDLGEDRIYIYKLDRTAGKLSEACEPIRVPEGYGPRHLTWLASRPDFLYVITELAAKVLVYRHEGAEWVLAGEYDTIEESFERSELARKIFSSFGAAIKPSEDGSVIYASIRGTDTIASFLVREDGLLERRAITPAGGAVPRDFEVFGSEMLCANQNSGTLTLIRYDGGGCAKEQAVTVANGGMPVCIMRVK